MLARTAHTTSNVPRGPDTAFWDVGRTCTFTVAKSPSHHQKGVPVSLPGWVAVVGTPSPFTPTFFYFSFKTQLVTPRLRLLPVSACQNSCRGTTYANRSR